MTLIVEAPFAPDWLAAHARTGSSNIRMSIRMMAKLEPRFSYESHNQITILQICRREPAAAVVGSAFCRIHLRSRPESGRPNDIFRRNMGRHNPVAPQGRHPLPWSGWIRYTSGRVDAQPARAAVEPPDGADCRARSQCAIPASSDAPACRQSYRSPLFTESSPTNKLPASICGR